MSAALAGLVGVLIGGAIGSAFSFWSVRRAELERAVVAGWEVTRELSFLLECDPALQDAEERKNVLELWRRSRAALILYIPPEALDQISHALFQLADWTNTGNERGDLAQALASLTKRTRELREDHQAFILTPLFRYLRGSPWAKSRGRDDRAAS
jgi:hypothetical protein